MKNIERKITKGYTAFQTRVPSDLWGSNYYNYVCNSYMEKHYDLPANRCKMSVVLSEKRLNGQSVQVKADQYDGLTIWDRPGNRKTFLTGYNHFITDLRAFPDNTAWVTFYVGVKPS